MQHLMTRARWQIIALDFMRAAEMIVDELTM
jgi:hypothetical protein